MSITRHCLSISFLFATLLAGCQAPGSGPAAVASPSPSTAPPPAATGSVQPADRLGAAPAGTPHLVLETTTKAKLLWEDRGTHANQQVSFWQPQPPTAEHAVIGDSVQPGRTPPEGGVTMVRAVNDDPANPLLKPPVDFELVWSSRGAGGQLDGAIWALVAPPGYVAIGGAVSPNFTKPNLEAYRCVRQDLCEQTAYGPLIWNDKGTSAKSSVAVYAIAGLPGLFAARDGYQAPVGMIWTLKQP